MLTPTGVTSSAYWDSIKAGNPTHVRLSFENQGIVLDDSDIDISTGLSVTDMFNGDTDLVFGRAVSKEVSTSILNTSKLANLIWTGEFKLEMGVEINGSTNWVTIGYFSGEKPKNVTSANVIGFTAYDRMVLFDVLCDDYVSSITYPATLKNIYDGLCAFVGVQNVAGDELPDIMNRTFTTAPADISGYTCRDILKWIAEACGCYATINEAGKVQMVWFTDNTGHIVTGDEEYSVESADVNGGMTWDEADTYTWDELDQFTWNDVCGYQEEYAIDRIIVHQLDSDVDILYPQGLTAGNAYMISDNPFLSIGSGTDLNNYVVPLYDRLQLFGGYMPVSLHCIGNWCVEAGDVITIDVQENTITFPIFVKTMLWNGAINDKYETTGNKVRDVYIDTFQKQKVLNNKEIRLFVEGNFYGIKSGIVINDVGVIITGGKSVRIESGGVFEVDSNNFKISSSEKSMIAGNWMFDNNGLRLDNQNGDIFEIKNIENAEDDALVGLYFNKEDQTVQPRQKKGIAELKVLRRSLDDSSIISTTSIIAQYFQYGLHNLLDISPYPNAANLGCLYPFERIRTKILESGANNTLQFTLNYNGMSADDAFFMQRSGSKIYLYCSGNNMAYLGSDSSITRPFAEVRANYLYGTLIQNSSYDVKHDIKNLGEYGDKIDALNPVTFIYDDDADEKMHLGLIYEEVIKVMPEICTQAENDKGINLVELIPVLLKETQELRKRVKTLEERGVN